MGQFSWLDCVTEAQIIDDKIKDVYVLIPKEFGGGHIVEHCYDGYGNFGGKDIFDLVADWNRNVLSEKPNFIFPYALERAKRLLEYQNNKDNYSEKIFLQICDEPWYKYYSNLNLNIDEIVEKCREDFNKYFDYRYIGISLACYDEDNEALPFPIKITYDATAIYENCLPSKSDLTQGWETYDEDDEWEEEQYWTVEDEEENEY